MYAIMDEVNGIVDAAYLPLAEASLDRSRSMLKKIGGVRPRAILDLEFATSRGGQWFDGPHQASSPGFSRS